MTTITLKIKDIKAVSHAMGNKDLRYYLNGMLIEHNGIETRLVATDGHRLHAVKIFQYNAPLSEQVEYIIPRDFVMQLIKTKFPKGNNKELTLTFSNDKVEVALPNGNSIVSKLIDGKFVDYRKVIPKELSGEYAYLNPQYQLDAVNGLIDYSEDKNITIKIKHNGNRVAMLAYEYYLALIMPVIGEGVPLSNNPYTAWTSGLYSPKSIESVSLPDGFEHNQSAVDYANM
jgi:DNA polymerase-3 subunit beta